MKILAFCGHKGSGKNTVCNAIVANELNNLGYRASINQQGKLMVGADVDGEVVDRILDIQSHDINVQQYLYENIFDVVKVYSFADALKEFCINVLGLSYEQCYGTDEQKNSLTHLLWENMPTVVNPDMLSNTELATDNPLPKRWREMLIFKQKGPMTAREVLQYFGTNIVRKMYGQAWVDATLRRINTEQPELALICDCRFPNEAEGVQKVNGKVIKFTRSPYAGDNHASETSVKEVVADYVCDNAKMTIKENCDDVMNKLIEWGFYKKQEVVTE